MNPEDVNPDDQTSYDLLPYDSHPYERTHPDHLASMAALFGMEPTDPAECRVLELGCASGGNLIPMAVSLPHSSMLGIDLSTKQIEEGQKQIASIGLGNVELQARSILDFGPEDGRFDYIVCHGVYSWVDRGVQDQIMRICQECLTPGGVAYISYNTNPGWYMRGMVRQMMCYHARQFEEPEQQVQQARALLDFLINSCPDSDPTYQALLTRELEIIRGRQDSYLFHEHLEEVNEPLFFFEFMERAEQFGLRYLCEVQLSEMVARNISPEVEETLARLQVGLIHSEQYLDFLRNRTFRRTLLCRDDVELNREIGPAQVRSLRFCSPIQPTSQTPNPNAPVEEGFSLPSGGHTAAISSPVMKRALTVLGRSWPQTHTVKSLVSAAHEQADEIVVRDADKMENDLHEVAGLLLELFSRDMVEMRYSPIRFSPEAGEKPLASPLARHQAADSPWVTNLRHEMTQLGDLGRRLLPALDGEHDRAALHGVVREQLESGELKVEQKGRPLLECDDADAVIGKLVDQELRHLAAAALLFQ